MTLSSATTPGLGEPGSDSNKTYTAFPKAPALLKLYHRIV